MKKLSLKKQLKYLYAPSTKKVDIVDVPNFNFAMIDGQMESNETLGKSLEYQNAIGALYSASFTLKFMSKLRNKNPIDYPVMALEGLWWTDSGELNFNERKRPWRWTMMIMQPQHITPEMLHEALQQVKKRKDNPALSNVRFDSFEEGLSMQIMHVGPYSEENRTIEKMSTFAREQGYSLRGRHHEIYLGDPRRAKPERLKTILRHPIATQYRLRSLSLSPGRRYCNSETESLFYQFEPIPVRILDECYRMSPALQFERFHSDHGAL